MKMCEIQNMIARNNEEWETGMKLLARCPNDNNHIYIPHLISLCIQRNKLVQESIKCES